MKENKYDHSSFFEKYSAFPRSVGGLAAAGEWYALRTLMPDFTGKSVLDIGCGFGWHCAWAAERGAKEIVGIDLSERMLAVAREKNAAPNIQYRCMAMENMVFSPERFDVVISSLAFHYTAEFDAICRSVWAFLKPGGQFLFSAEHPVFTAQGMQEWCYSEDGSKVHWPVDRYFEEGKREACFLGEKVTKYHRTLSSYLAALLMAGFTLRAVVEPRPDPSLIHEPGMLDELRRPMMMLVSCEK